MTTLSRAIRAGAFIASTLVAACGGGESSEQSYRRFSQAQEAQLAGDWDAQPDSIVVKDAAAWQSRWQQRRSAIDCTSSYNQAACATADPPAVDFTKYAVVGSFAGRSCTFEKPEDPAHVFTESDPSELVVEVGWMCASSLPFVGPPANLFVLVHQTELPIVVR